MQFYNMAVLAIEAVVYFLFLITLLHWRHRIGIGVFITVLATMHFLETYLASALYVPVGSVSISPGSVVLFAGKLLMVLLLYIKEDAATVRQLIYGLLVGNLMTYVVGLVLSMHVGAVGPDGSVYHDALLGDLGLLMLWGTSLLYLDSIAIILIYERLGPVLGRRTLLRFFLAGAIVLTFDQIGFYGMLHWMTGAPSSVFYGGLIAKMAANLLFAMLTGLYLYFFRSEAPKVAGKGIGDVFLNLTYRERYQELLARTGRDALTGVFDRGRLELEGPEAIRAAVCDGVGISLMIVDADRFKDINDRYGHLRGDEVLREVARVLTGVVRSGDSVYRFGGEEFVVLCRGLGASDAFDAADRIRHEIGRIRSLDEDLTVSVSIGVATAPKDGSGLLDLISSADRRLYRAKAEGRNRVIGF
jgi:diguanylate cyclase (GGDEF)-like protein